jgi:hypothetical protein
VSTELVQAPQAAVALIQSALAAGHSPEHLRELLAVRRDWEADEGRKAFNRAVSEFQRRTPIIAKADRAHDKYYARLDRIWREIRPLLGELGLSVTWQVCELREKLCHVEGQLRHRDGHGEALRYDVPLPELIRSQNAAQQMGSASTYAKRYALCAALGIVTGDDDDGHSAGTVFVTHDQAQEIAGLVDACRGLTTFNETAFWGVAGAAVAQEIAADRYEQVRGALLRKLGRTA